MSKKKKQNREDLPEVPDIIKNAVLTARKAAEPTLTPDDEKMARLTFDFLRPLLVIDPHYKGNGEAGQVLREPYAMLTWDRRNASWKWNLGDKVYKLTGAVLVSQLASALVELEKALEQDTVTWAEK